MANVTSLRPADNVPESLRRLAYAIENGEYGHVEELALALDSGEDIEVFGFGQRVTEATTFYLLNIGARLLLPC